MRHSGRAFLFYQLVRQCCLAFTAHLVELFDRKRRFARDLFASSTTCNSAQSAVLFEHEKPLRGYWICEFKCMHSALRAALFERV
jgi:hypothetical protein